jgi:hypothetical protein
VSVWYSPLPGEQFVPSAKIRTEVRRVFESEAEWVEYFGEASPGIDWDSDWAIFYTPGTTRPDLQVAGWRSRIKSVSLSSTGRTLSITTRLEHNGDCPWRRGRPFVTVTIPRTEPAPEFIKFFRSDVVRDCD